MLLKTFAPDTPVGQTLGKWWHDLPERRGERAALARCHNPMEVVTSPEYHLAFRREFAALRTQTDQPLNREAMPAVLGLLACIRHADKRSLASALAKGKPGDGRGLSDLRFRRLLQVDSDGDLYASLRRALALIGKQANVHETAELVYRWHYPNARDPLRKQLAYDFYQ